MAVTAAELLVVLKAQDQMSAVLHGASSSLGAFSTQTGQAARMLAGFGTTAVVAGIAGVAAGFAKAVSDAAEFEKTMSGVKAVSGATAPEMVNLAQLALKLGADTKFTATEAGKGIEELVKAGVSLGDVMGGAAAASLNLAAAGEISVAESASIAANAMNVFGLKGADMAHVTDLIAGAANASAIDVNDFRLSLAASGAVAATVGFSFDDLATGIAIMGQAGIRGSDAGTSLKTMMLNLQPVTDKQVALFRELGIVTADGANQFFDASGKVKSMADVAQVLQTALSGMTEQQKLATLETIFGSDAIRAGAVLAKAGAAGFNEMAAAMANVTAESVGNTRLDNLSGSIEKLGGALNAASITIGTAFLPVIRQMVDALTGLVVTNLPAITQASQDMAAAFSAAIPAIVAFFQTLIDNRETIAQVAAGLAALVVITTVIGWVVGLISAMAALGAAFATVASLFAPVVAGVAAVGTAIVALGSALTGIGTVAALAWSSIAAGAGVFSTLGAAAGLIVGILGGPVTVAILAVVAVVAALAVAWANDWGNIRGVTESVVAAVGGAVQGLVTVLQSLVSYFAFVVTAGDPMNDFLADLPEPIQGIVLAIGEMVIALQSFTLAVTSAGTVLQSLASYFAFVISAGDPLNDFLVDLPESMQGVVLATGEMVVAFMGLVEAITTAWADIQSATDTALADLGTAIIAAWDSIFNVDTKAAFAALVVDAQTTWDAIVALIDAALALLTANVTTAWAAIQAAITAANAAITADITSAWAAIEAAITAAMAAITASVTSGWASVQSATESANTAITAAVKSAWDSMAPTVSSAINAVKSAADSGWNSIKSSVQSILNSLVSAAGSAGSAMVNAWAQGVTSRISAALSAARKMADEVRKLLNHSDAEKGPLSDTVAAGRALPETLAKGILSGIPGLLRTVDSMAGGMAALVGTPGALGLQVAGSGGAVTGSTVGLSGVPALTININAPVYGVNDMEDVVVKALDRARSRGRA